MTIQQALLSVLLLSNGLSLAAEETAAPMSTKEKAIKAAKIAGWTAGLIASLKCYSYIKEDRMGDSFIDLIHEDIIETKKYLENKKFKKAANEVFEKVSVYSTFLGLLGLSIHGLYTEIKPLVQPLVEKIQNKIAAQKA